MSEKRRHVQRQIDYAVVNLAVACMEDIRRADICPVLAAELVERNGRVVLPALDFNRKYILYGCQSWTSQ